MDGLQYRLDLLAKQLENLQRITMNIQRLVATQRTVGGGVPAVKVMPFPIKDISSAQLVDAYRRGLDLEQLEYLCGHKYTQEQIVKKIQKYGGNV